MQMVARCVAGARTLLRRVLDGSEQSLGIVLTLEFHVANSLSLHRGILSVAPDLVKLCLRLEGLQGLRLLTAGLFTQRG